jgi:hypothetical protein
MIVAVIKLNFFLNTAAYFLRSFHRINDEISGFLGFSIKSYTFADKKNESNVWTSGLKISAARFLIRIR